MSEQIEWIEVGKRLPDADATVLVYAPTASEPLWLGYYCDEMGWHTIDHDIFGLGQVTLEGHRGAALLELGG